MLDPGDSYRSEWVGGKGGFGTTELSGGGTPPIVGVIGKANNKDCTGLGLLLKKESGIARLVAIIASPPACL